MEKKINLQEYEKIAFPLREQAFAKAAELLGLSPDSSEALVIAYITEHYEWYQNDEEYKYMGYDCGDCYMGGDVKKGIVCGDHLVVYVASPTYKLVHIYKKK